jgi:pyruvate/2-oxoglutarate dehydrogenase complex dihydrolipoamide acyltransferase (E2) component
MFGKRSDGVRIKNIDPIFKIIPHIMKARHDSQNSYLYPVLCDPLDDFINQEKANNVSYNYMHIVIAAVVRLIALRPQLNRFVMNGRHFKRKLIYVSFAVKKTLKDDGRETTIKLAFTGLESISDIKNKIDDAIVENANVKANNNTDKTAKFLTAVPNFFIKFAVGFLKFLDKHGMLPKKIIAASPFHTTFFITNLKSIKIDFIYHHLYDFGTTGIFISMGKEKMEPVVSGNHEIVPKKVMNIGVVTDERFCDGLYYANSLRLLKRILENPNILATKLEKANVDID